MQVRRSILTMGMAKKFFAHKTTDVLFGEIGNVTLSFRRHTDREGNLTGGATVSGWIRYPLYGGFAYEYSHYLPGGFTEEKVDRAVARVTTYCQDELERLRWVEPLYADLQTMGELEVPEGTEYCTDYCDMVKADVIHWAKHYNAPTVLAMIEAEKKYL